MKTKSINFKAEWKIQDWKTAEVNKTGEYLILATASLLAKGKLAVMGVGGGGVDYGSDPNFRRKHSAETLSAGSGPWVGW